MTTEDIVLNLWLVIYLPLFTMWIGTKVLGNKAPDMLRTVKAEVHPFMPYLFLFDYFLALWFSHGAWGAMTIKTVMATFMLYTWFKDDDDDDRWKKRRKRLSEKVANMGHKLVPVPA